MKFLLLGLLISCSSANPKKPVKPKSNYVKKCFVDSKKTKLASFYSDDKIKDLCKCAEKFTDKSVAEINKDEKTKNKIIKECF